MAEKAVDHCLPCWEISISLNIDRKVSNIFEKLTTEIAALRGKLEELKFPRSFIGRSWKMHSEMKLFVFSNSSEDVERFLEWNSFSSKKRAELSTRHEVEKAVSDARDNTHFVLPIALISKADYIEKPQGCLETILHLNFRDICIVLTFQPKPQTEWQTVLKHLQTDSFPLVFAESDAMFCGFITRKIKDWMFKNCENILESSKSWLQDLKNVPTCAEVENCLNMTLEEINRTCRHQEWADLTFSAPSAIGKWQRLLVIDKAVGELCKRTVDGSFNKKPDKNNECDLWMYLQEYFHSFLTGMMTCIVKINTTPTFRYRKVYTSSPGRKEVKWCYVLNQVKYNWPKCMKDHLNEEIQTIKQISNILQMQFIPKLNDIMKISQVYDEVAYEIQIRLSRMPEVRSFGIEDKQFTVYVDSQWLKDDGLLKRLDHAVQPYYKVDNILEWTEPEFHHRNDLIRGENNQTGMITTFAQRVDMNGVTPHNSNSLYFITCAHLAPEREMPVYFLKCSSCESKLIDCPCERKELGINMYPFDRHRENPFNAVVDITCGIVYPYISKHCDSNNCGLHTRQIQIVDFTNTIENHTGKTVLKWDCKGMQQRGTYSGVQYMTGGRVPRRVDIIKCDGVVPFGIDGHCGALTFLLHDESEEKDAMSPTFVYLGKWPGANKFMCFRLQEGLECLEMEHNLKLRLCLDSQMDSQINQS